MYVYIYIYIYILCVATPLRGRGSFPSVCAQLRSPRDPNANLRFLGTVVRTRMMID